MTHPMSTPLIAFLNMTASSLFLMLESDDVTALLCQQEDAFIYVCVDT